MVRTTIDGEKKQESYYISSLGCEKREFEREDYFFFLRVYRSFLNQVLDTSKV
jgi:hypothetical protein